MIGCIKILLNQHVMKINEENDEVNTEEDDLEQLIPDDLLFLNSDVTARGDADLGTFETIIEKDNVGKIKLPKVHVTNQNIFLDTIIEENDSESDKDTQNNSRDSWNNLNPATVQINQLSSSINNTDDDNLSKTELIENVYQLATKRTLDDKQVSAYSIICSSFMLQYLLDNDTEYDPKKTHRNRSCGARTIVHRRHCPVPEL